MLLNRDLLRVLARIYFHYFSFERPIPSKDLVINNRKQETTLPFAWAQTVEFQTRALALVWNSQNHQTGINVTKLVKILVIRIVDFFYTFLNNHEDLINLTQQYLSRSLRNNLFINIFVTVLISI